MTYTAIGFDWGGVLDGKPSKYFGVGLAEMLGITEQRYRDAYFSHNKEFNQGMITIEELWTRVLGTLGMPNRLQDVLNYAKDYRKNDGPNHDVIALVDTLRRRGYKTALLSNNTAEKASELRAAGFDSHFDVFHVSAETGLVKPAPESFVHLADALEVRPSEMLFIDDTPKSLESSGEVGFTPLLFDSYDQLVRDLKKLGVSV